MIKPTPAVLIGITWGILVLLIGAYAEYKRERDLSIDTACLCNQRIPTGEWVSTPCPCRRD